MSTQSTFSGLANGTLTHIERVQSFIYDHYELSTPISFRLFASKNGRDIYDLETLSGHLIVKVLENVRSVSEIVSATKACSTAYHAGLPVPDLILSRRGTCFTRFEDRYIYIYRYAEGQPLVYNERTAASVGRLLAGLHALPLSDTISKHQFIVPKLLKIARAKLDREQLEIAQHYSQVIDLIGEHVVEIQKLPLAVAHGDLSFGNVLLKGYDVAFLIDFDEAGRGSAMFDLAYFIGHVVSFSRETPTIRGNRKVAVSSYGSWPFQFMCAYQAVRPLSPLERTYLPLLVQFVIVRWHGQLPNAHSKILDTVNDRVSSWLIN